MLIAIDVGLSGAVALFTDGGTFIEVFDLPTMQVGGKQAYVKNVIASAALAKMLEGRINSPVCYVETVSARPKQGVASMFSLGASFGSVTSVLAVMGYPYILIRPHEWKKHFHLKKATKEQSRAKAMQLYPDAAQYLARKKDHNRAEAILLGRYVFEKYTRGEVQTYTRGEVQTVD